MKKVWSISTAVRNPDRLRNFLKTLKEIEGKEWDKNTQKEFQARLIKNRFYGFGSSQFYSELPKKYINMINDLSHNITLEEAYEIIEIKQYVDIDMRGRQSYKPLEKLGFATIKEKRVFITSLGEYFLSDDYDLGELFFKSFLKWQYPNPIDRDFNDKNIYNITPFLATLHLIDRVNKLCKSQGLKEKGISKIEFMIFGQSLLNYKDIDNYAKEILKFRKEFEAKKDFKDKKLYQEKYIEEFLKEFSNVKNIKDYADNTIRYFRLTRYIYIRGGGFYIDLEPRREIEINSLLKNFDASANYFKDKNAYLEYISDITQPKLPWQNKDILQKIYSSLIVDIKKLGGKIDKRVDDFDLEKEIKILREYRKLLQDDKLKQELQEIKSIDNVIENLKNIRNLDLKPSIALEKYITQALTIINDAINIKANSLRGDDGEFIFTASANKPDIECFYESFNSICEVTMLTNRDQWHNEGQPVMRHLREFENKSTKDENYCIFVAPALHRDTINTFWIAVKYEYEGKKQKIIPLTIAQIIEILKFIKKYKNEDKHFSHKRFKKLLDDIISHTTKVDNSNLWINEISNIIKNFVKESI